mmetsp:Transcript_28078/g.39470  ORF Transcript_28078/g.39470 Transcript_28078/m.39470 type:complete len:860 (-) Transcript_28078:101-2680(-)
MSVAGQNMTSPWGFSLTTHRDHNLGADAFSYFQYECFIAAVSICFCRLTIKSYKEEPKLLSILFSSSLAFLAYTKQPYEIICALQLFSYAVPIILTSRYARTLPIVGKLVPETATRLILIALSAAVSPLIYRFLSSGLFVNMLSLVTPEFVKNIIFGMFPIEEIGEAYKIIDAFSDSDVLQKQLSNLLFVTFNIQVGIGYLGINFLKEEQMRRNALIRMELVQGDAEEEEKEQQSNKEESSITPKGREGLMANAARFKRGAAPFIFFVAVPYMIQIIALGNMNMFAYTCVRDDMHRAVRLNELFDHDTRLVAMAEDSATSPSAYATSMDQVVSTTYDMFNRKLFSLPKLLLLPGVIRRQPMLIIQIFPFIFASDILKARIVAYMTSTIERLNKESKEIDAIRNKVEAFDMKNAELLQRSGQGATRFTQRRWEELTEAIQEKTVAAEMLRRTKGFFAFLQRNFIFGVLIDCALATLIAVGKIASADIFVFSRAIEDAVDLVLMKSRAESELAAMDTEISKLKELADVWESSKERNVLPCHISPPESVSKGISIRHLQYARGTAMVRAEHIDLEPGIYALTGGNGSGKSTLFRILMSCETNEKPIDLPSSIALLTPEEPLIPEDAVQEDSCRAPDDTCEPDGDSKEDVVPKLSLTMPSSDVVEISQNFYWPLYSRPIDWIYQCHLEDISEEKREGMVRRVAEELNSLEFTQSLQTLSTDGNETDISVTKGPTVSPVEDMIGRIMADLEDEKEDWFSDLSGGQKSKVELVRKVFLNDECPKVLLIDETMAPLDPTSKSLVMSKIKSFCEGSVVLVIYHTDVGVGKQDENNATQDIVECVPSNNFFDHNIHVENHFLTNRPVC